MKHQKGLTLVEVLIIFAIIGILAAVIIPSLIAFNKSRHEQSTTSTATVSIDRTIAGTVVTIDRVGNYSTLHFSDGTTVVVTNESIDRLHDLIGQVWVYELHQASPLIGIPNYDIVRVHNDKGENQP